MSLRDLPARLARRYQHHAAQGGAARAAQELLRESAHQLRLSWRERQFQRLRRERAQRLGADLRGLACPGEPGLVSVVLPVYNGADLVAEALDSILAQAYPQLELIVINDGSTDETPRILEAYAARDARVRLIHQENRKIPRTLSRGFRAARGEFLTWTSADNRLKPGFLTRMVACLRRHPGWDMVYANQDLIGADGRPLRGSDHFAAYQQPPGSEHVLLPERVEALSTGGENFVGAAFLYRSRVAYLIQDYNPARFMVEDYDYFLQVNALLNLRHADFAEPVYEYRFHGSSLTSRFGAGRGAEQLRRLLRAEARRWRLYRAPLDWQVEDEARDQPALAEALRGRIRAAGQRLCASRPGVYVRLCSPARAAAPPPPLPGGALRALVLPPEGRGAEVHPDWDLCAVVGELDGARLPRLRDGGYQGLLGAPSADALLLALDVRSRVTQAAAVGGTP